MSLETPPEGASCAGHPDVMASWVCGRCGTFMCTQCERRTRPEARPMCPTCWDLRTRTLDAPERDGTGLLITGLVLGVLSLLPVCLPIQVAALVVNFIALGRTKEPPERKHRWMAITGLILTAVGFVGGVIIALMAV